jgi:hypothetical protein
VIALAACLAVAALGPVAVLAGAFDGWPGSPAAGRWMTAPDAGTEPAAPGSGAPSGPTSSGPATPGSAAPSAPGGGPATPPGWTLMWSPQAGRDGLGAFEGVEDDRAHTDPGVRHIYVQGNNYRFDMPMNERDTSTDRQRNEVKGMNAGGRDLSLGLAETWRLDWSLFIPDSLQGTDHFTHIMQLKMPGDGSSPILTMDLARHGGVPKIDVRVFQGDVTIASTDLAPLQNTWLSTSLVFTVGDAPQGAVSWTLTSGNRTVVTGSKTGVDTWLADRVRPKWGIYRSVQDTSGSLHPCYLLLSNMRAYKKN